MKNNILNFNKLGNSKIFVTPKTLYKEHEKNKKDLLRDNLFEI